MTIQHLQLVIPDALAQLRLLHAQDDSSQALPALHHCLHYGSRTRLWQPGDLSHARLDPWQQSLMYALPHELRHHALACSELSWRGNGGEPRPGVCLCVEPVHFQAGLDDVRCLMPPPLATEEADAILQSLQPFFSLAGFELVHASDDPTGAWYLWCERDVKFTTFSLQGSVAARLYDLMPQGPDAGELRRLMTEVQMLLHDHPVNKQRERRGILPVNALWFWGYAPMKAVSHPLHIQFVSASAYVRGLSEHLGVICEAIPSDAHALLAMEVPQMLCVLPQEALSVLDAQWLQPIYTALLHGVIERLDLHVDHWQVALHSGRWQQLLRWLGQRQDIKDFQT